MRILFAGTPEFACPPLAALSEDHELVAVFSQPDRPAGRGKKLTPPPVKVLAQELEIAVYQPSSLKDQAEFIRELDIDVMVVVAYGMLLPQSILSIPKYGCINIHASILPRWRGAAPIQRAIEAGDPETGVSIMQMDIGLDTGDVFAVAKTTIKPNDTSATLHDRLSTMGARSIVQTLTQIENSELQAVPQTSEGANYAKKITKQEAIIDWQQSAIQINQRCRAFIPWPICQTQLKDTRLRIWETAVVENKLGTPGSIIEISEEGILVACGENSLSIKTLQKDGSKPMSSKDFLNGFTLQIGDQLG